MGMEEIHFGGAEFAYHWKNDGALSVETQVIDPERTFSYSVETFRRQDRQSNSQHAVFWLPTAGSEIFFAMHNVSDRPIVVSPELRYFSRSRPLPAITIPAHGFSKLRLPDDLPSASVPRARLNMVGSIVLNHEGAGGALHSTGWIDDEATGYSTMMTFVDLDVMHGQSLFGAQILTGRWRGVGRVRSIIVLKNMSLHPVNASAELWYTHNGSVGVSPLALDTIPAGATRRIDLQALKRRGLLPAQVREVSIEVRHSGHEGALMGRSFGISANKTYGFYGVLEHFTGGARSEVRWSLEGSEDSIITIANFADRPDTVTVELAHNRGSVELPEIELQAKESRTIDLGSYLRAAGAPALPPGVRSGGYRVTSKRRSTGALVVKQHIVDTRARLSSPFYGGTGYVTNFSLVLVSGSLSGMGAGDTAQIKPWAEWSDNTAQCDGDIASQNTGQATLSGFCPATVTPVKHGNFQMVVWGDFPDSTGQFTYWQDNKSGSVVCEIQVESVSTSNHTSTDVTLTASVSASSTCSSGAAQTSIAAVPQSGTFTFSYVGNGQVDVVPGNSKTTSFTATKGMGETGTVKFRISRASCGTENPGCKPTSSSKLSDAVVFNQ